MERAFRLNGEGAGLRTQGEAPILSARSGRELGQVQQTKSRTTEEVLEDHLRESKEGSVEDDLQRNFAEDLLILTTNGVFRGHEGMRSLNRKLQEELPKARLAYTTKLVAGEMAFLEWTSQSESAVVEDGVDSYCIRDGRIVAQTIHYTVRKKE
jgi:hypothetical protein